MISTTFLLNLSYGLAFVYLLNVHFVCYSQENVCPYKNVSYEEVNLLKDDPKNFLIDVREPCELQEDGSIPGSINIPLDDLENALTSTASDFKKRYGKNKPEEYSNIIFSCRSGRRSQLASKKAVDLGFKNVSNYSGSWLDWEKHNR